MNMKIFYLFKQNINVHQNHLLGTKQKQKIEVQKDDDDDTGDDDDGGSLAWVSLFFIEEVLALPLLLRVLLRVQLVYPGPNRVQKH